MINLNRCKDCKKELKNYYAERCPKCAGKQTSIRQLGDNNPNFKINKKKYCCKTCGEKISDYRINRCKSCANKQLSLNMMGNKNHAFKKGLPKCVDCGKELSGYNYKRCERCYTIQLKTNPPLKGLKKSKLWRKKISIAVNKVCLRGRDNPMFGKVTHPKYIKYKGIWMHSSWEIAYAKYLDKNNISWHYEFRTFDLGNTTYTPDFYLPESNTYIEVKGYWREDAIKKFKLFKKQYKKINLQVLDYKLLKSMEVL